MNSISITAQDYYSSSRFHLRLPDSLKNIPCTKCGYDIFRHLRDEEVACDNEDCRTVFTAKELSPRAAP